MSATLYVLGNGFDLAHNLPTTYRDFFYFLETIEQNKTNIPLRAKLKTQTDQLPEKIIQKIENGLRQQDTTTSRCMEVIYSVLKLNNPEETNLWHCYFKKRQRNNCSFATWIDFEKEIATLAKSVVDILSSDPSQIDYTKKSAGTLWGHEKNTVFLKKLPSL